MTFYVSIKCPLCTSTTLLNFNENYSGTIQCSSCAKILQISVRDVFGNPVGLVENVRVVKYHLSLSEAVPKEIREDFEEAMRCFNDANAYKSTVAICRRALEKAIDSKGGTGNKLVDKLQDLHQKNLIDDATFNTASGIRQFGNYGSHPQDDLLKNIEEFEAEIVLKITGRLLTELFK